MGWMTQVASIPDAPPFTNGFTLGHTPPNFGFASAISRLIGESRDHRAKGTENRSKCQKLQKKKLQMNLQEACQKRQEIVNKCNIANSATSELKCSCRLCTTCLPMTSPTMGREEWRWWELGQPCVEWTQKNRPFYLLFAVSSLLSTYHYWRSREKGVPCIYHATFVWRTLLTRQRH